MMPHILQDTATYVSKKLNDKFAMAVSLSMYDTSSKYLIKNCGLGWDVDLFSNERFVSDTAIFCSVQSATQEQSGKELK